MSGCRPYGYNEDMGIQKRMVSEVEVKVKRRKCPVRHENPNDPHE
jgi:hypothetical protein